MDSHSRYPYGYERAEDLAGLAVALVIWASAVFAGVESYRKLVDHAPTTHVYWGMVAAAVGIVGNQVVARYKRRVGTRIHSATLLADAKHSWLDAVSSLGALVGLAAVAIGFKLGDPIAGFLVTLFIVHVGYEVTKDVLHHLMDGVEPALLKRAEEVVRTVVGADAAAVRGRWLGRSLALELDVVLPATTSLGEADTVVRKIERAVRAAIDEASVVTVVLRTIT